MNEIYVSIQRERFSHARVLALQAGIVVEYGHFETEDNGESDFEALVHEYLPFAQNEEMLCLYDGKGWNVRALQDFFAGQAVIDLEADEPCNVTSNLFFVSA